MKNNVNLVNPRNLKKILDSKVIGQDTAKKQLCIALENQVRSYLDDSYESNRKNLFLLGDQGTGKSEMLRAIETVIDLPVVNLDAFELAKEENLIARVLSEVFEKSDVVKEKRLTEHTIIIIENLDNILTKDYKTFVDKDGLKFLNQLEIMLKNNVVVNMANEGEEENIFDLSNFMFIVTATLPYIDFLVRNRLGSNKIGFLKEKTPTDLYAEVKSEDLIDYGLPANFVGDFDSIILFKKRTKNEIKEIVRNSDILALYKEKFAEYNIVIDVKEEALEELAEYCLDQKLGLWSVKNIIERKMTIVEFDLDEKQNKVVIKSFLDV